MDLILKRLAMTMAILSAVNMYGADWYGRAPYPESAEQEDINWKKNINRQFLLKILNNEMSVRVEIELNESSEFSKLRDKYIWILLPPEGKQILGNEMSVRIGIELDESSEFSELLYQYFSGLRILQRSKIINTSLNESNLDAPILSFPDFTSGKKISQ